ncbi:hypothetical protein PsorP6_012508 [Peronosclerospora sorghi]|uniref:Uncharacterized protein n=1 Tax=Peronosclerospora sorghi TaxID=230839 RepID=A0ACC0WG83_9STRA|nr:hypothetical protein PsorP6_012508 [Peronosclerospora sorghi]
MTSNSCSCISRLLVLSPDKNSTLTVVSKLHELSGQVYNDRDAGKSNVTVLTLKTKYYRAPVEVHMHHVLDNAPEPAFKHELDEYEALVCIVDANEPSEFRQVRTLAERIVDRSPYDVCLFVAGPSSNATTECVEEIRSWCQEKGFEFVELGEKDQVPHDTVINEKQGMERVLEALHCNMWRSIEMTSPQGETAVQQEVKAKDKSREMEKREHVVETSPATDDSRLQTLLQALEIGGGPHQAADTANQTSHDDFELAQLSALISEVKNVRDHGQHLSDEQRRERAAEVAMKLWNVLGDESDSD